MPRPSRATGEPVGRPSKYDPSFCDQARKLCLLGATDQDIADFFEVSVSTVSKWKADRPDFAAALRDGKIIADANVAARLYERATGFEWDEAQPIKLKTVVYENGKRVREEERIEIVMVHRVVPPDTTADIFWLKNRQPERWRDKQDHEHSGKDGGPIQVIISSDDAGLL